MGFLPFVNQGGQRVIRWHRLVLAWIAIIVACVLGNGVMSWALVGDFWGHSSFAVWFGVFLAASFTVAGFNLPVEKLPPYRPRSPSGGNTI